VAATAATAAAPALLTGTSGGDSRLLTLLGVWRPRAALVQRPRAAPREAGAAATGQSPELQPTGSGAVEMLRTGSVYVYNHYPSIAGGCWFQVSGLQ
jgi:hypothetical protein